MKYVKCVHESGTVSLTKGKIYEVIHFETEWIRIANDDGNQEFYYLKDSDGIWFVDATPLIREQKLNQLGI
jgi:hypothetical protein